MNRQKILIGIGLVGVAVLIGAAIYFMFFRAVPAPTPTPPPRELIPINAPPILPPTTALPPGAFPTTAGAPTITPEMSAPSAIAAGGRTATTALTDGTAQFLRIAADGPRYYDPNAQGFFRLGSDGKPIALSKRQFPNVQSVAWSPDGERAIVEFPDGANVSINFRLDDQVTLPQHWEDFSFAPNGERIAGKNIGLDRENQSLFEADPDGNAFRAVESLGSNARKVIVSWSPNEQVVAFSRTGNDLGDGRQQILLIGKNNENFPGLTVQGTDFRPLWSPSGARIIYSAVDASNDYKPELWSVDGVGDSIGANRRRLGVNTWADRCTFADDVTVYCTVPDGLIHGAGLVPSVADNTPDSIERIDLRTGASSIVGRPDRDMTIRDLRISTDGAKLYFTANDDGRLYEIRLR
ncbi:MAG: hypothetical protein V1723_00550 [Candidatus Uhrbacteria bacterium]